MLAINSQLPQARKIQIANFGLDAYYDYQTDTYYFSATQIAKTFSDNKAGGVQFLNSRRAEPILEALSELRAGVKKFIGVDSRGVKQQVNGLSEVDAILYIVDIFRKKPSPKLQLFLSILAVDSLRRFCDRSFGVERSESEYKAKDQLLFKTLNQRKDCDVVDRDSTCHLLTSTELAIYLNLPISSKNTHRFAAWMLKRFPGSDRILSRRLYDADSREIRAYAARFFELEALYYIQFEKQSNPNAFDDELIESFEDM